MCVISYTLSRSQLSAFSVYFFLLILFASWSLLVFSSFLWWTLFMFFWKWTLWMVTWVLCQVFAPLSSCFSGKGKLGLLWPVRSPTLLVICGNMPVLARTTPSLWICCASGSRCFGFHLPCYSAKCFLRSFLPSGSSGSLPANHSLHYSLLLQLSFLKILSLCT